MISYKFFIFLNLFYLVQIYATTTGSGNGTSIVLEFFENERKITVEGWRNVSWSGEQYFSFRSISYVVPPIAELRFKDPQPLKQLPAYIDARYEGHDCHSVNSKNASEDCLKINIYTPNITETANLPVVFHIHYGALLGDSGRSSVVGANYLLSKPVVLVSINYRLGALGFLQLGTREIPGNAGFKDQVQALRWIQKYIKHFGGNPRDVTIMGYSAGSLCVSLHLVSPMSQGLFHKAILMSGAYPMQSPMSYYAQLELLRRQALALNCTGAVSEVDILKCMQAFSGQEIFDSLPKLFKFGGDKPPYLFLPVVERDFGQERFLVESALESMQRGAFAKVPLLIGFTNGELCVSAVNIYADPQKRQQFSEEFEELAPMLFMYDNVKRNLSAITDALQKHHMPNFTEPNEQHLAGLCDMFSDAYINYGAQLTGELAAKHTKVFPYRFDFRGDFSSLDYPFKPPRVVHGDDYAYLFGRQGTHFKLTPTTSAMIRLYTKFMYDFVAKGSQLFGELPTYPHGFTRIVRTLEPQPGAALDLDTYELWKSLFL